VSPNTLPSMPACVGKFVLATPATLGALAVNDADKEVALEFAAPDNVRAAMLVVLATLALVIFAFPSKSSVPLFAAAETPVNAGRLTPPENIAVPSMACADTEAGVTPIVCLVSSAENGVSDTAAKPNIYSSASKATKILSAFVPSPNDINPPSPFEPMEALSTTSIAPEAAALILVGLPL